MASQEMAKVKPGATIGTEQKSDFSKLETPKSQDKLMSQQLSDAFETAIEKNPELRQEIANSKVDVKAVLAQYTAQLAADGGGVVDEIMLSLAGGAVDVSTIQAAIAAVVAKKKAEKA